MKETFHSSSFFKQVLIYGSGLALNYSLAFFLIPLYTRYLAPADYGVLEIINRTAQIIGIFLVAGFGLTLLRFFRESRDEEWRRRVVSTAMIILIGGSALIAGVLFIFRGSLTILIFDNLESQKYVIMMLGLYFFQINLSIPLSYYQAKEKPVIYVSISISKFLIGIALNIIFLLSFEDKVMGVLIANLLNDAFFVILFNTIIWRQSSRRFHLPIAKEIFKFTWSFTFTGLCGFIIANGDRFFLLKLRSGEEVGLYALAYKIGGVVCAFVFTPIIRAWSAIMVDTLRKPNGKEIMAQLATYATFLYFFFGLLMSIFSEELMALYADPKYIESAKIIPILVFGYGFWGITMVFDTSIYFTKKTYFKAIIHGITTIFTLLFYWLLIPKYGIYGAATATLLTYFIYAIISWYINVRVFPVQYEFVRLLKIVVTAIILFYLGTQLESQKILLVILFKFILVLLYPLSLWILRFFTKTDFERIRGFWKLFRTGISRNVDGKKIQ